ncbi:Complement C1r subcomponent, partial [Nibea albiflora]
FMHNNSRFLCLSASECWKLPDTVIHGEVHSPQYPQPYLPNLLKQSALWVPEGYKIQLSLTHLDIKASAGCYEDSLTVLDDQKVLGKFCDIDECLEVDSAGGSGSLCSQICVNSRGSYRCSCHNGYKLHLDQRTCLLSCSGNTYNKHEGHLSSPKYPSPSPPLLSCKYIISVEPRFAVTLNFTDKFHIMSVDTEQGPRCLHHWLQVTVPDREPMKLCGGKSPGLIATDSSTVRLDYHTDNEGLSHGWSLEYTTDVIDCGEPEPLLNGGMTFQNQHRSVVQYHCNEPFYTFPGGANVCGKPTKQISTYQRIIGGSEAPDDTIPWQVLLNINGIRAGGMVIADNWIMTAAHDLIHNGKPISNNTVQAYVGRTDVKALYKSPVYAASVHVHPGYNNPDGFDYNNDIALIKVNESITFNSSVMPICLPSDAATYIIGMMGIVSGFGITNIYPLRMTKKLKYADLPVVEQDTCLNSVNKVKMTRDDVPDLTNNMFCVGVPEGGKNSCLGDHGGPFALKQAGQFWAAGIVSWGVDCGQQGMYGVYTRVGNYVDWIKKTMQEN